MKKILLIAFLLTFAAGSATAQQIHAPGTGTGGPGTGGTAGNSGMAGNTGMTGNFGSPALRLTEELGLDVDQAAEIELIFEEAQLLRAEEQERAQLVSCDNRANTQAQIFEILTPEQQALYAELQQKRDEFRKAFNEMKQARGGFGGGRGMQDCGN
jgi:Spy/CpxP family protein refolding chaperone